MQQVTVCVPASTSNLGPGFDCLGVALRVYNHVTIARGRGPRLTPVIPPAAKLFFHHTKQTAFPFTCSISGDIPECRGLGSSAAVRLGLLHGLNALAQRPLDRHRIFALAAQLEGHPDNAAAAEFGGFTVARASAIQRFSVSSKLHFVLLIPDFKIVTREARRLLPARIPRISAVESCGNACALTAAFASRKYDKVRGLFMDHLHQPYRKKLIPFFDDVIDAGEKAGALGGFLSGSGSTIVCITLRSPEKVATAMLHASGLTSARTLITPADNRGARIVPFRNPQSMPVRLGPIRN